ncbi:glycosyltransferase [Snuella lapsa]|uniref:Glycosyltransferase n=1 Tax=Snuella lapsa TaxID=870481 RepID=A0ABP6XQT7_9FLAO
MQNNNKKRICIVARSLGEGGADRVASLQSIFLSDLGYEVYVVSFCNYIKYPYKGILLNLGELKDNNNNFLGKIKRLLVFRKFINNNKIDVIIDHRVRSRPLLEVLIAFFVYKPEVIYIVHNYKIDLYFPSVKQVTRFVNKKAKCIVAVSSQIEQKVKDVYRLKNVRTIYNPIDFDFINSNKSEKLKVNYKYIFWYGRLEDEQKNIKLLIEAYKESDLVLLGIKLIIMGSGKDENKIKELIFNLGLQGNIVLLPFSKNPFAYINKSIFVALSSRYEGLPMTILESLACGIPVVSVDYNEGNNKIVQHGYNGLLVKNNDVKALADAFNTFVTDEELYKRCKKNAKSSVRSYDIEHVAKEWGKLIAE